MVGLRKINKTPSFISPFSFSNRLNNTGDMFSLLLEKEPSEEDIQEVEEEEAEEEEKPLDEQTVFLNEEILGCFALFDTANIGTFDVKYLEKALRCLGIFLTSIELEDVVNAVASDGVVTFEKFQEYAFEKLLECDAVDSLKMAFKAFDPDNEGLLPNDRVRRWLTTLGDPLTEKEVKELIKLGDPAGKGLVAYDGLIMVLLRS